jgi:hypothetical protein
MLTVILVEQAANPQLRIAETTLSLASLTALSGKPTRENPGNPEVLSTSISTGIASTPRKAALLIL